MEEQQTAATVLTEEDANDSVKKINMINNEETKSPSYDQHECSSSYDEESYMNISSSFSPSVLVLENNVRDETPPPSQQHIVNYPTSTLADLIGALLLLGAFCTCIFALDVLDDTIGTVVVLLAASITGGFAARKVNLPPLLGMIVAGLILRNFHVFEVESFLSEPLPRKVYAAIRTIGLSVILMRSGLEIDLSSVRKAGWTTLSLTCFPGLIEAFTCGAISYLLFDIPILLGITLGFILAAVSPAVIVSGMFELHNAGYGTSKGIPSLVVAAASFDDVLAISGFSVFMDLALKTESSSLITKIMHGPSTIVFGITLGLLSGLLLSFSSFIWNERWKRTAAVLTIGLMLTLSMSKAHYPGSGMLGCLVMGIGWRSLFLCGNSASNNGEYSDATASDLATVWYNLCEPLLFGAIGHALDFDSLPKELIMQSMVTILFGLFLRVATAYLVTGYRGDLTRNERLFIALAWIPKATVQAALCSLPLDLIQETMSDEKYVEWGEEIKNTAILSILLTAPIGSVAIQHLGPRLLLRENCLKSRAEYVDEESSLAHERSECEARAHL